MAEITPKKEWAYLVTVDYHKSSHPYSQPPANHYFENVTAACNFILGTKGELGVAKVTLKFPGAH